MELHILSSAAEQTSIGQPNEAWPDHCILIQSGARSLKWSRALYDHS